MNDTIAAKKLQVHDFWNRASCGEDLYLHGADAAAFEEQAETRYRLEPYIREFARFDTTKGMRVLEIGVGLGADHQQFAQSGADLYGIDLTARAVEHTSSRLACFGLRSNLSTGDAEHLNFPDNSFDLVYSWGVLHHSPDTPRSIAEVHRVLKSGGEARIMVYHKWSMVGLMLWIRYAVLVGQPWRTLRSVYAAHLESPGTKAYSLAEARLLFSAFSEIRMWTVLTHGDLLESSSGQRHQGVVLSLARAVWPRRLIRRLLPKAGLFMLIEAKK